MIEQQESLAVLGTWFRAAAGTASTFEAVLAVLNR